MSTDKKSDARRSLMKKILASGGVITASGTIPGQWAKPIVESVMLPAHAQVKSK